MRPYLSIWDAIFGRKTTIELPMPDGSVKRVRVTRRWFAEMQQQGKITPISPQTVKVHILDYTPAPPEEYFDSEGFDSGGPDLYRVEEWTIGRDISAEQYNRCKDPKSGELYALISIRDGQRRTLCVAPKLWLALKRQIDAMERSSRDFLSTFDITKLLKK